MSTDRRSFLKMLGFGAGGIIAAPTILKEIQPREKEDDYTVEIGGDTFTPDEFDEYMEHDYVPLSSTPVIPWGDGFVDRTPSTEIIIRAGVHEMHVPGDKTVKEYFDEFQDMMRLPQGSVCYSRVTPLRPDVVLRGGQQVEFIAIPRKSPRPDLDDFRLSRKM